MNETPTTIPRPEVPARRGWSLINPLWIARVTLKWTWYWALLGVSAYLFSAFITSWGPTMLLPIFALGFFGGLSAAYDHNGPIYDMYQLLDRASAKKYLGDGR